MNWPANSRDDNSGEYQWDSLARHVDAQNVTLNNSGTSNCSKKEME